MLGGDSGIVRVDGKLNVGLARYCNNDGSGTLPSFTLKSNRKKVCGIKVLSREQSSLATRFCRIQ